MFSQHCILQYNFRCSCTFLIAVLTDKLYSKPTIQKWYCSSLKVGISWNEKSLYFNGYFTINHHHILSQTLWFWSRSPQKGLFYAYYAVFIAFYHNIIPQYIVSFIKLIHKGFEGTCNILFSLITFVIHARFWSLFWQTNSTQCLLFKSGTVRLWKWV